MRPDPLDPHTVWWRFARCGPNLPMSLTTSQKQDLINTHQTHSTDTGSVEVQVAMLSERINQLIGHLQIGRAHV